MAGEAAAATAETAETKAGEQPAPPAQKREHEPVFTAAQAEARENDAFGRGIGKVLKKLGVKDEDEAIALLEKARKAPAASKDGAPDEAVAKHVEAATEKVRTEYARQLEAKDADATKWKGIAERHAITSAIVAAANEAKAVSVDHVAALLRSNVRFKEDGSGVEVVDSNGVTVYGKDGKPISIKEYVGDWLASNPHFLPAGVKPGAGGGPSPGGGSSSKKTITRAELKALPTAEQSVWYSDPNREIKD